MPYVSGAATSLWNNFAQYTNLEVRNTLQNAVLDKGVPSNLVRLITMVMGILRYYASESILADNCGNGPNSSSTQSTQCPSSAPCTGNLIGVEIVIDNYGL